MVCTIFRKMEENIKRIATYQFMTAFSQLLSRICHPHEEVSAILKDLIARCLQEYPQQTMWAMMAVSKSTDLKRSSRCKEIFVMAQ